MNRFLIATLALAMSFTLSHGSSAKAQDSTAATPAGESRVANGTRFGAWTVTCEAIAVNETACVLSQSLVRTSENQFLAEMLAFFSADLGDIYLAARVPNGVFFPSGFAFKPENSEERQDFIWQSCSRDLCEAMLAIDADKLKQLEEGEAPLFAGYRPRLGVEPVVFRLSLEGVTSGLAALKAALEAKR